jgi:hypothetical protein
MSLARHLAVGSLIPVIAAAGCAAARPPSATTASIVAAPRKPDAGHVVYFVGGDSRGDGGHVLRWAFQQAASVHARGFIFLGDMEWSRNCDDHFAAEELAYLGRETPLFPVLGNHEIQWFGFRRYRKDKEEDVERRFQRRFLDDARIVVPVDGRIFYSVDLDGGDGHRGLHFIALDNVSRDPELRECKEPHGEPCKDRQYRWLADDLARARRDPQTRFIIVGMHKPLAGNCTGRHSMEEDGGEGLEGSRDIAELLAGKGDERPVDALFVSHEHYFAKLEQRVRDRALPTYVTGGLGAHLKDCSCPDGRSFHHVLLLDVGPDALSVSVMRWPGKETRFTPGHEDQEDDEDDGEPIWRLDPRCADGRGPDDVRVGATE